MTVTHAWTAVYRHFDDDALAALASVGLLRRAAKDVEADKVAVVALGESGGQLRADGQLVSLDAGGLVRARCDCPAPGICKHILAAALWLRAAPVQQASPPTDPLMEALALDPDALLKSAGTAAVRKAGALFADVGAVQVTVQGGTLIIALAQPEFTCRYVAGAGFAGMVSEAPESARATLHLLALAGLWRAHGQAFPWPVKPSLEAGDAGLAAAERQFLERLRALLLELSRSGWSHVNAITASQLRAFAMSARVESLPRVASLLRTLAAIAAALAARDTQADERLAIKLAARITALCDALAAARGGRLVALRGRGQRSFQAGEALDVLP
ncbi:MAG: SWIM zinc finger family protein, partial [Gammaproteobacteria bacterium]